MSCENDCRFESADTSLNITFLDGTCEIDAYWESIPRVGESVSLESLIENDPSAIAGVVTAIEWRQVRGIYGNPFVLVAVGGFDLSSVCVALDKSSHEYSLVWNSVTTKHASTDERFTRVVK